DRVHRRHRANPQRHHHNHRNRESRRTPQRSHHIAKIPPQTVQHFDRVPLPHVFAHVLCAPKFHQRPPPGLDRIDPPRHVLVGLMRNVPLNLSRQFRVLVPPSKISPNSHGPLRRTHRLGLSLLAYLQSLRNGFTGSNRDARHAGNKHAAIEIPTSTIATPTNTLASIGCTPYNKSRINRVAAAPAANPNTRPNAVGRKPSARVSRSTSPGRAPSAMRRPSSLSRWVTRYDSTPYNPTDASSSDSPANVSSNVASKFASMVDFPINSFMVITSHTGSGGSRCCTIC